MTLFRETPGAGSPDNKLCTYLAKVPRKMELKLRHGHDAACVARNGPFPLGQSLDHRLCQLVISSQLEPIRHVLVLTKVFHRMSKG